MKYRFKPKPYGWWFVPVSIAWWVFTFLLLGVVLASAYSNGLLDEGVVSLKGIFGFGVDVFVIVLSSSWFMSTKTKKKLKRRRWNTEK